MISTVSESDSGEHFALNLFESGSESESGSNSDLNSDSDSDSDTDFSLN